jgi:hypothetical protein
LRWIFTTVRSSVNSKMNVNISREMAMIVVTALEEHCKNHGWQIYKSKSGFLISNHVALDFFRGVLVDAIEKEREEKHARKLTPPSS